MINESLMEIIFPEDTQVYRALEKVLSVFEDHWEYVFVAPASPNASQDVLRVGLLVAWSRDDIYRQLAALIEVRCDHTLVVLPSNAGEKPWDDLTAVAQGEFEHYCRCVQCDVQVIIKHLRTKRETWVSGSKGQGVSRYCEDIISAKALAPMVIKFSHGQNTDAANLLWAPARMLIKEEVGDKVWVGWFKATQNTRTHLNKKYCEIKESLKGVHGRLAASLVREWEEVDKWLSVPNLSDSPPVEILSHLERLMELFTDVRELAGLETTSQSGAHSEDCPPGAYYHSGEQICYGDIRDNPHAVYRVLVIDDHAAAWAPILHLAAQQFSATCTCPVGLEFSLDGTYVEREDKVDDKGVAVAQVLPDYDLVLLDVFLNGGVTGLSLLKTYREKLASIPIVLWTSSRERSLPAKASLASGFLFKKRATIQDIKQVFGLWLPHGQSHRRLSLPNPFFDHVIRHAAYREQAYAFTNWSLKFMDGFHALDSQYYKFFMDHGGRHLIHLLSILERLLRPFILPVDERKERRGDSAPALSNVTEEECLAVYLAVYCHEIGMFPAAGEFAVFERADRSTLFWVRKYHAARGMMILSDPLLQSGAFRELIVSMSMEEFGGRVLAMLGLLTGYHGRFLELSKDKYCMPELREGKKFPDTCPDGLMCHPVKNIVKKTLCKHEAELNSEPDKEAGALERTRQLCALFRFADALDVDHTRIPADYLLHHHARSVKDDVENFSRQIVEEIRLDSGLVSVVFRVPRPDVGKISEAFRSIFTNCRKISDPAKKAVFPDVFDPDNPWNERTVAIQSRNVAEVFLEWYFGHPDRGPALLSDDIVAGVAALYLIGEIAEEYEAIEDVELDQHIRLGRALWSSDSEGGLWRKPLSLLDRESISLESPAENSLNPDQARAVQSACVTRFGAGTFRVEHVVELGGDLHQCSIIINAGAEMGEMKLVCVVGGHDQLRTILGRSTSRTDRLGLPGVESLEGVELCKYRELGVLSGVEIERREE